MARHYGRNSRISFDALRQSIGVSGYVGYSLREKLPRVDEGHFYAKRFRERWMSYPAAGPFIVAPQDLPRGSTVSYLSCGVPHDFAPAEQDRIKRAFDEARFIYMRDAESAEKLTRAGVSRNIWVAPDVTVTLSDHFARVDVARRGRELLSRFGIAADRPVMCFQSQPYPGFDEEEILDQLRRLSSYDVVLLPLGYCHGDHEFLQSIARRSRGEIKCAGVSSVFDMMAVIVASDLFVGTSLHGNITAFSFGIPHVLGPLPVSKTDAFLNVANLPAELRLRSWAEMSEAVDRAVTLGPDFFAAKARDAKARVYRAVDELLSHL